MGMSLVRGLSWPTTRCYRDEAVSLCLPRRDRRPPRLPDAVVAVSTPCGGRRIPGTVPGEGGSVAGAVARPGRPSGRARAALTAPGPPARKLCWLLGMVYLT